MKRSLKTAIICISAFLLVMGSALVIHIYMVTKLKNPQSMIQLGRIDFQEKIDSAEAKKIISLVSHLGGVEHVYFNIPDGILVYGYTLDRQNSTNVFNQVMYYKKYNAIRFVADPSMAAKGCPVMDRNSLSYKVSSNIQSLFN